MDNSEKNSFPALFDSGGVKKSIVVLGIPRGGTSMIASGLQSLGVFIGDAPGKGNLEDIHFRKVWNSKDENEIHREIKNFNQKHEQWAVKVPSMWQELDRVPTFFQNSSYIFVARDPMAIAMRSIAIGRSAAHNMPAIVTRICGAYTKIASFIEEQKRPSLFISYDKANANPQNFVESLALFCGAEDNTLKKNALSKIESDHKDYLARTSAQ